VGQPTNEVLRNRRERARQNVAKQRKKIGTGSRQHKAAVKQWENAQMAVKRQAAQARKKKK